MSVELMQQVRMNRIVNNEGSAHTYVRTYSTLWLYWAASLTSVVLGSQGSHLLQSLVPLELKSKTNKCLKHLQMQMILPLPLTPPFDPSP